MSIIDVIAEEQGWTDATVLDLLKQYVANQDSDGALEDFLREASEPPEDTKTVMSVTAKFLLDHGLWMKYCDLSGLNSWCINEGQMDSDERLDLTQTMVDSLGLGPSK